jgi:hypothetical protein
VSSGPVGPIRLVSSTADAEDLVKDMERLRVAVEETSRIGPTGPELTLPPPEAPPGPPPLGPG